MTRAELEDDDMKLDIFLRSSFIVYAPRLSMLLAFPCILA